MHKIINVTSKVPFEIYHIILLRINVFTRDGWVGSWISSRNLYLMVSTWVKLVLCYSNNDAMLIKQYAFMGCSDIKELLNKHNRL